MDRTLFTDLTARASAWLSAGELLGDRAAAEFGGRALDRDFTLTNGPGNGVAHWFDGQSGIRGLLTDQVTPPGRSWRFTTPRASTWSMLAEELMRTRFARTGIVRSTASSTAPRMVPRKSA